VCSVDNGYCKHYYCNTCQKIHPKDRVYKARLGQQCKCPEISNSNFYTLWERDEDVAEIEFYYDKVK